MSEECSVFINGGAIVFVPPAYGESVTSDLMNSILFAQLVANKRVVKKPLASWSAEYVGVLDDFWVRSVREKQDFLLEMNSITAPFEWAVKAMANGCEDDVRSVGAFVEWIARLPCSSRAMKVLRRHVQQAPTGDVTRFPDTATAVRLLVILAQTPAAMSCLCLEFKTRQTLKGNPWTQRFQAEDMDGHVSARYFRATLSETLYKLYREAIALKLKDRFSGSVMSLAETVDVSAVFPRRECGS